MSFAPSPQTRGPSAGSLPIRCAFPEGIAHGKDTTSGQSADRPVIALRKRPAHGWKWGPDDHGHAGRAAEPLFNPLYLMYTHSAQSMRVLKTIRGHAFARTFGEVAHFFWPRSTPLHLSRVTIVTPNAASAPRYRCGCPQRAKLALTTPARSDCLGHCVRNR